MPVEHSKDDLLRKISGLLAKAESTEFEAERESFLRAANNMMDKYRIELWEIQQREAGLIVERTPQVIDFDYKFAFETGPFPEICDGLWSLFLSVARHTNCVIVTHKQHYSGVERAHKSYTVPIIGTEVDLGYMTLLFSSLMTQLITATHPTPDKSKSLFENLKKFREAGWGWDDVGKAMQEAGFDAGMARTAARDKYIRFYRSECKRLGIEQNYANWKTFRRNFAQGFAGTVSARFLDMRQATNGGGDGNSMALALRDQDKINREWMMEQFPQTGGAMRGGSSKAISRKHDEAAVAAGRSAGAKADISMRPGSGLRDRKTLNK